MDLVTTDNSFLLESWEIYFTPGHNLLLHHVTRPNSSFLKMFFNFRGKQ